jgi:hypothetical protein
MNVLNLAVCSFQNFNAAPNNVLATKHLGTL